MVEEGIRPEFIGIVNYCIIALIQIGMGDDPELDLGLETAEKLYTQHVVHAKNLMEAKNHDYGEAWRDMRISSFTDMMLMRILRIKQIEDNDGRTIMSEGVESNYYDMINYGIFALIKMEE
jgi:hypothetical protein